MARRERRKLARAARRQLADERRPRTRVRELRRVQARKRMRRKKDALLREEAYRTRIRHAIRDDTLTAIGSLMTREGRSLLRAALRRKMVAVGPRFWVDQIYVKEMP